MRTLFCLLLGVLPNILRAQLDCPSLGFSDVVASSGAALSRCARADEQCCTQEYIDSVQAAVVAELQDGLMEEFADVIEEYQDDVENLIEYFKTPFLERLISSLPPAAADMFDPTNQELLETVNELSNNYIIPEDEEDEEDDDDDDDDDDENDKKKRQAVVVFNPRQFVERLIGNAAVAAFNNSNIDEDCVRETALSLVNSNGNAVSALATRIQTIRQSLSTLNRIQTFLEEQRGAFVNNVDLNECVSKFMDIAFCSRCTESTPPLCFNACNALLRACYSPYYTALNEQIAPLWVVANRIVDITEEAVESLFDEEGSLFDFEELEERVERACTSDEEGEGEENQERGKREEDQQSDEDPTNDEEETKPDGEEEESVSVDTTGDSDSSEEALNEENSKGIPEGLADDISELTGAFNYRMEGFDLCLSSLNPSEDCSAQPTVQEYCNGTEICTARCYCTAGDGLMDSDIDEFLLNDVFDQGDNPVVRDDQDFLNSLNSQAATLAANDDPVAAFLQSSAFTSVAPEGAEGTEEGNSAAGSAVSLTLLFFALLLVTFV